MRLCWRAKKCTLQSMFDTAPTAQAADGVLLARLAIQTVAQQHGLWASFHPKPLATNVGIGCHTHWSLTKARPALRPVMSLTACRHALSCVVCPHSVHKMGCSLACLLSLQPYLLLPAVLQFSANGLIWLPVQGGKNLMPSFRMDSAARGLPPNPAEAFTAGVLHHVQSLVRSSLTAAREQYYA